MLPPQEHMLGTGLRSMCDCSIYFDNYLSLE